MLNNNLYSLSGEVISDELTLKYFVNLKSFHVRFKNNHEVTDVNLRCSFDLLNIKDVATTDAFVFAI